MLQSWIIEEIRRREEEHEEAQRPELRIEIEMPYWREPEEEGRPPATDRGVTVIDFG